MTNLAKKIAALPFAKVRTGELRANAEADGGMLASLGKSIREAAWRGKPYEVRALVIEARPVLIELLRDSAEWQAIEGESRLLEAEQTVAGKVAAE